MNYTEEQAMEMEALAAIFGDQFEQKSPSSCTIHTTPNADETHLSCYLDFDLPPKYPEVLPELTVRNAKGMNDTWNLELKDKVLQSAPDLLGAAMLFTLTESARDWLTERNVPGVGAGSMYAQMIAKEHEKQRAADLEKQQQAKKEEIASGGGGGKGSSQARAKQEPGTAVTPENFLKWSQGIIKEEARAAAESASKLTGRQLFEKGTVKVQEEEVMGGDVEDFDRNLILEEEVDPDMLEDDDEDDEEYVPGEEEDDDDEEDDEDEEQQVPNPKSAPRKKQ